MVVVVVKIVTSECSISFSKYGWMDRWTDGGMDGWMDG
jgi:hypothetical protein